MAQSIIATTELSHRIDNILRKNSGSQVGGGFPMLISLSLVAIAFSLVSATTVFTVGDEGDYATENLRLLYAEQPVYPESAFARGIEGLNQFSFSVDTSGKVDLSSIRVEFSKPASVFDESSIQALKNFQFKPRKVRGKIIPTPGVRYSFSYNTHH